MKYYACCNDNRRSAVGASPVLNGIDFVEVVDHDAANDADRQRLLRVHFIKPVPANITRDNIFIAGGDRIRRVEVDRDPVPAGDVLELHLDKYGDYSSYRLRFVQAGTEDVPLAGLDPLMWEVYFWFKVECESGFDCQRDQVCPTSAGPTPHIDYLAKDYASFRRLMLDHMSAVTPGWLERRAADMGIAAVEALAYVADHLSYQQDAIATEAYLGTARRRVSVRRHARLVDYFMHDGCNARTWVHFEVSADQMIKQGRALLTHVIGQPVVIENDPELLSKGQVFEVMADQQLREAHNQFNFYTWGDDECCLPAGATEATLEGHFAGLKIGDVLVFMEVRGPRTGQWGDADPAKRHAVRLKRVDAADSLGAALVDPLTTTQITQVHWNKADRLPFPLCISSLSDEANGSVQLHDVSIALGNIVPADHGWKQTPDDLGTVEQAVVRQRRSDDRCDPKPAFSLPARFNPPVFPHRPVTQAARYDATAPASKALRQELRKVGPQIWLTGTLNHQDSPWSPQRDLLNSNRAHRHFVVEVESDGSAMIRFGDDEHGMRPRVGAEFKATYRIGNGHAGNIGADAIAHIVDPFPARTITNPLPATGGMEPESVEQVRRSAPEAFRIPQRAVTEKDYEEVALRCEGVQRAAATFRWTGSWYTVYLTVDREQGLPVDRDFKDKLRAHMEKFRMAGYDLEVDGPRWVSLDIQMQVCVKADYFRSAVARALFELFSSRNLAGGGRGVFHPDNFTFEQPVYLSRLYAAAQAVDGVRWVRITRFERLGTPESSALESGKLTVGRLEIARLDADPNFPDRGKFDLLPEGGK